jgi:bla regulator protein blaR1
MMVLRAKVLQPLVVSLCLYTGGSLPAAPVYRVPGQSQQASSVSPQFDVVSIRPNISGRGGNVGFTRDGYQAENVSFSQLVIAAYGLRNESQIVGFPGWAKSAHYDVDAKVGESDMAAYKAVVALGYPEMNKMLRPVLEDRFGLRCHWEKRILPTYTLTLAKKGSALKDSTHADSKMVHVDGSDASIGAGSMFTGIDGRLISRATPIRMLVDALERELNSIVVDETGLKGTYDYELHFPRAPEGTASTTGGIGSPEPMQQGDSVAGSLYEIGLKLVPSKTEQPVLVVDAIQQPSPN